MDDDCLCYEQSDCGLNDDKVCGLADQSKGHNQRRRPRRRMRTIQENHQRSRRGQREGRGQNPRPAQFRDNGRPGMMQPCHPQRRVSAGDTDGVTAQRVPRTRRRSRGREKQQERRGSERGKNERRLEEHRQPAQNANTDEAIDEHEKRPHARQLRRADHVRPELMLSCLGQQVFQCVTLREDLLEFRLGDPEERGVLTRAKARVAMAGAAGQQRLLAHMVEFLELRQNHFVPVPVNGEDLHRTPHDNIGAIARFAFPEDERLGGELDDLGDLGQRAELAAIQLAEQGHTLEELFAFRRNHDSFRVLNKTRTVGMLFSQCSRRN